MRDVHNFKRRDYTVVSYTGKNAPKNVVSYVDNVSTRTQRDDSKSTPSVNGKHFQPTGYHALFCYTSPTPGFAEWGYTWPAAMRSIKARVDVDGARVGSAWRLGINPGTLRPDVPTHVVSAAREAVLQAMRNSEVDIGITIGESKETLKSLVGVLKDIADAIRKLSKAARRLLTFPQYYVRRMLRDKRLPKGIHMAGVKEYLRFMFGIRPAVADAHGYALQIEKGFQNSPIGKVQKRRSIKLDPSILNYADVSHTGSVEVGSKVGVDVHITDPERYQLWRFGLTNPVAVAWELVSLSFVVDWFTGMGAFIRALSQPLGCIARNGYETQFAVGNVRVIDRTFVRFIATGRHATSDVPSYADCRIFAMQRGGFIGFIPPVPYLKLGVNLNQAASIWALIASFSK